MSVKSTPLPRMKTDEAERYLLYNYISQLLDPTGVNVPFLIGPPGVGKSYVTKSALTRLTEVLAVIYLRAVKRAGVKEPEKHLQQAVADAVAKAKAELAKLGVQVDVDKTLFASHVAYILTKVKMIENASEDDKYMFEKKTDADMIEALVDKHKPLEEVVRKVPVMIAKAIIAKSMKPEIVSGMVIDFDTTIPLAVYRDAAVYVQMNMGIATPDVLAGVPMIAKRGEKIYTALIPPYWAVALRDAAVGVFNMDEFANKSAPTVVSISYGLVLNKQAGTFYFSKPVVATGNTKASSELVSHLPGPLFTGRLEQVLIEPPDVPAWLNYMNRKYGSNWPVLIGVILDIFSKYGSVARMLEESEDEETENIREMFMRIRDKLSGPFGDIFYPDLSVVKKYSKILPGEMSSYPSPRAWEHVAVEVQRYLEAFTVDPRFATKQIELAITAIGLPTLASVIANALSNAKPGGSTLEALTKSLNLEKFAEKLKRLVTEGADEQLVKEIATDIATMYLSLSALLAEFVKTKDKNRKTSIAMKLAEIIEEANQYRRGTGRMKKDVPAVFYKIAALILLSVVSAFKNEMDVVLASTVQSSSLPPIEEAFCP